VSDSPPSIVARIWPTQPYKGLSYYGPDDVPIFAGRDRDVERCAYLISSHRTRIVILQGTTGSGKSSFLRAGLIPFLERKEHGYAFVKESQANGAAALFIRSTHNPLLQMCEAVFAFANASRTILTPMGPEAIDLSAALLQRGDLPSYVQHCAGDPAHLIESLDHLSSDLPETLILVVDQVEEVLTLNPGSTGDTQRADFFRFLRLFAEAELDMKILLATRTEFYGRIVNQIRRGFKSTTGIDDYYLDELDEDQLVEAIERPTSRFEIDGFGAPYNQYGFSFELDLPRRIARELQRAIPAGGILPVLQIVCDRLYRSQFEAGDVQFGITLRQYKRLGGIEGQLDAHLTDKLLLLCQEGDLPDSERPKEVRRWRLVLMMLVRQQVDGTVTTEVRTVKEFKHAATRTKCKIDVQAALDVLSSPSARIVRPLKVYNARRRREIACLALGHDAVGLVLKEQIVEQRSAAVVGSFQALAVTLSASAAMLLLLTSLLPKADNLGAAFAAVAGSTAILFRSTVALRSFLSFVSKWVDKYGNRLLAQRISEVAEGLRSSEPTRPPRGSSVQVKTSTRQGRPREVQPSHELAVLGAASLVSLRTFTGIQKDAGLSLDVNRTTVDALVKVNALEVRKPRQAGSPRYRLTSIGRVRLNSLQGNSLQSKRISAMGSDHELGGGRSSEERTVPRSRARLP
jgi:hypothetical protein